MLNTLLLIPHGHCYLWKPNLVGLHLVSDALISIAYYSIPFTLFYFVQKRKDVPFGWIFLLFAAFIVFCGTTHLMSIWTLWHPAYWSSGIIKALTAGISVYTAIQLIPIIPKALDLPSPAQLEVINYRLQQEVAEHKQTEMLLRESKQRYATLLATAPVGIFRTDASGYCTYVNDRWCQIVGLTPETSAGEGWIQGLHPDDQNRISTEWYESAQKNRPFQQEFRFQRSDGTMTWIYGQSAAERDTNEQVVGYVGTIIDISDRKRAEEQTQYYATKLKTSNLELEAFAYSVSHDLRAPLRAIDGFSQALLEDYGEIFDEDARDYFDRIRKNVTRMGKLIDDLLSLSRVSRYEMSFTKVNLSALAQELMDEFQALEPERQVEFAIAPEVIVYGDPTLMRVVLTNLLQNAWKFTSHHPRACIEFGTIYREQEQIYFVRDDGAGFDMAHSKMLFGVFQRLHDTNEFPGTGIGLATVQRAIERHGGRIWAEGAVEQGSTFYFTLSGKSLIPNSS